MDLRHFLISLILIKNFTLCLLDIFCSNLKSSSKPNVLKNFLWRKKKDILKKYYTLNSLFFHHQKKNLKNGSIKDLQGPNILEDTLKVS